MFRIPPVRGLPEVNNLHYNNLLIYLIKRIFVLDAFALMICATGEPPAYPGVPDHEPDAVLAGKQAQAIGRAMDELRKLVPNAGSYVSESDFWSADGFTKLT